MRVCRLVILLVKKPFAARLFSRRQRESSTRVPTYGLSSHAFHSPGHLPETSPCTSANRQRRRCRRVQARERRKRMQNALYDLLVEAFVPVSAGPFGGCSITNSGHLDISLHTRRNGRDRYTRIRVRAFTQQVCTRAEYARSCHGKPHTPCLVRWVACKQLGGSTLEDARN